MNIREKITGISWYKTGEGQYLGGNQEGLINYNGPDGRTRSFNSVVLLGNGAIHRQNINDLSADQWELMQAEYNKIFKTTDHP